MTMDTNIPSHITPLTWMEATSPLFQFSKHPNLLKRDNYTSAKLLKIIESFQSICLVRRKKSEHKFFLITMDIR